MQSEEKCICPCCQRDFGTDDVRYVKNTIIDAEICEYCWLEIGLEFDLHHFGSEYTTMAAKRAKIDVWQVRYRYLQDIIQRINTMLGGVLGDDQRHYLELDCMECNKQLLAIDNYQQTLSSDNTEATIAAITNMEEAFETIAFDISIIRGCGINHLTG